MASPKHYAEYALLRGLSGLLCILPYRAALALAWVFARIAFHVVRFRRRKALARIHAVFPSISNREAKRIAWQSLRNLFFNIVELMRIPVCGERWLSRHFNDYAERLAQVEEVAGRHNGMVLAIPHCGNWDLAGIACSRHGIKMCAIAGRQRNKLVDGWLERVRGGLVVIERGRLSDIRRVPRMLRDGFTLAVLPDVRMRRRDLAIPFLGGTANLGSGMARFAREAGVPVLPVVIRREGWTRFDVDVLQPIMPSQEEGDGAAADQALTEKVMAIFDSEIRKTPGQWFWYNSRWVLDPVE